MMSKYPLSFKIWSGIHIILLLQSIDVYHGSINFFFPFCITETKIQYWPSLASYDFLEFFVYVFLPFAYFTLKPKKVEDAEKTQVENQVDNEQINSPETQVNDNKSSIKWYDKPKNAILLSLLFFPLGLYCIFKSKQLQRNIKLICLALSIGNIAMYSRGIYEEYEKSSFEYDQATLQLKFDDFNSRKNLVLQEDCLTTDCIDLKISSIAVLLSEVNSIYYEAKAKNISINRDDLIAELREEANSWRSKKYAMINEEKRKERIEREREERLNAEKGHYDSLAALVYEAENVLDAQEYKLDHLRRYDAVPDLGIFFYVAFAKLRENEDEIELIDDLAPRLITIKRRMSQLIQRTTYM